jgi:hypothetical protein
MTIIQGLSGKCLEKSAGYVNFVTSKSREMVEIQAFKE